MVNWSTLKTESPGRGRPPNSPHRGQSVTHNPLNYQYPLLGTGVRISADLLLWTGWSSFQASLSNPPMLKGMLTDICMVGPLCHGTYRIDQRLSKMHFFHFKKSEKMLIEPFLLRNCIKTSTVHVRSPDICGLCNTLWSDHTVNVQSTNVL